MADKQVVFDGQFMTLKPYSDNDLNVVDVKRSYWWSEEDVPVMQVDRAIIQINAPTSVIDKDKQEKYPLPLPRWDGLINLSLLGSFKIKEDGDSIKSFTVMSPSEARKRYRDQSNIPYEETPNKVTFTKTDMGDGFTKYDLEIDWVFYNRFWSSQPGTDNGIHSTASFIGSISKLAWPAIRARGEGGEPVSIDMNIYVSAEFESGDQQEIGSQFFDVHYKPMSNFPNIHCTYEPGEITQVHRRDINSKSTYWYRRFFCKDLNISCVTANRPTNARYKLYAFSDNPEFMGWGGNGDKIQLPMDWAVFPNNYVDSFISYEHGYQTRLSKEFTKDDTDYGVNIMANGDPLTLKFELFVQAYMEFEDGSNFCHFFPMLFLTDVRPDGYVVPGTEDTPITLPPEGEKNTIIVVDDLGDDDLGHL